MKECFKCKIEKPLSEFYKHAQMSDGHVNKCKECTKKDVRKNLLDNHEHYKEYEHNRYAKNGARYKSSNYKADHKKDNEQKYMAVAKIGNALRDGRIFKPDICEICGEDEKLNAHHWSYEKDNWLDVVWCCERCHARIHSNGLHLILPDLYKEEDECAS